ncbi:MAG: hypothetical protein NVS1B14_10250 [Vulcanimicrobiaceae bacterium]
MRKRLEELDPGTPVLVGDTVVGEVRGVYATGEAALAEYLDVFWTARDSDVLVPTSEVLSIEENGILLQGPLLSYDELPKFTMQSHPTVRRLR